MQYDKYHGCKHPNVFLSAGHTNILNRDQKSWMRIDECCFLQNAANLKWRHTDAGNGESNWLPSRSRSTMWRTTIKFTKIAVVLREIERGIAKLEKASKQYLYENTSSRITNTHFLQSTQQNMFYKGWYSELQSWAVELIVKYIRFAVRLLQCQMDNSLKDTFNFCWFVF